MTLAIPPKSGQRGALDRIGPSESQSVAMTTHAPQTDRPHIADHWRSREKRRAQPPTNVDALVAWFAQQYAMEIPDRLHGTEPWADHGTLAREVTYFDRERGERVTEVKPGREGEGGSLLGSPKDAGLIPYVDGPPHLRDDEGDLVRPMRSAMAALRHERKHGHDALVAIASFGFDWRKLIDRPFYRKEHRHGAGPWCSCSRIAADDLTDSRHVLVMQMPADILEDVLTRGLTRLWWLLAEREPHIREV